MLGLGLLILRLVVGLTIAAHGAQKLFGWFEGPGLEGFSGALEQMRIRPSKPWATIAALAEFVGGLLVAAGFLSPLGSLAVIGSMVVAIATVHVGRGFFNTEGGIEFPLLMAAAALALALTGPGRFSVDAAAGIRLPEPLTLIVGLIVVAIGVAATLASRRVEGTVGRPEPG